MQTSAIPVGSARARRRRWLALGVFTLVWAYFVGAAIFTGTLAIPPDLGDGQDYDALAYNLQLGRGFGFSWDDPVWRRPYEEAGGYKVILARHGSFALTAERNPGFATVLALFYAVVGRNFVLWRVFNCAVMAGAVTLAALLAETLAGWPAALGAALLCISGKQFVMFAHAYLSEALAAALLTTFVWFWLKTLRAGASWPRAVGLGLLLGALGLVRSFFVPFLPVVLLLNWPRAADSVKLSWRFRAVGLAVALSVLAPWWARNIMVTGAMLPLGTEGSINLPAGFSDRALAGNGEFEGIELSDEEKRQVAYRDPLAAEVWLAQSRTATTLAWMRAHPAEVAELMVRHAWAEVRVHGNRLAELFLLLLIPAGLLFWRAPLVRATALLFLASLGVVAIAWSSGGHFLIPLMPLFSAVIGSALSWTLGRVLRKDFMAD